jgi:sucrose synthase
MEAMIQELNDYLRDNRDVAYRLLRRYAQREEKLMLQSVLHEEYKAFAPMEEEAGRPILDSPLEEVFLTAQEAVIRHPWFLVATRYKIARWRYLRFHLEDVKAEEIETREYLAFKETLITGRDPSADWVLEIDLGPFNRGFQKLKETRSIGQGVEFLNRNLSSRIFMDSGHGGKLLFDFLKVHQVNGVQLMLNHGMENADDLRMALRKANEHLTRQSDDAPWSEIERKLKDLGFEPGWGKDAGRVRETMHLLLDLLEAPDYQRMERFLDRIPMIFKIAILSPHGFFGQTGVLGMPDTGGQVVYILDQVRALEAEMFRRINELGIEITPRIVVLTRLLPEAQGTTCDRPREHIVGTENAWIVRVPFRGESGEVVPHWISRFEIWPYLEQFAYDAEREMLRELDGRPDLIVGNYSDGNLVASLMSQRLHVTQCNIAHALEKTKYLFSGLYWREMEERYHFSCQFTADLIAMNTADFIIASTYQEIAGNEESVGQYESYASFTMPGLYRVLDGIDVFDPKFNIVSPGADEEVYFPYTDEARRLNGLNEELEELVNGNGSRPDARGRLERTDKPLLFAMSRLDRIKNVTGLTEWYAQSPRLRELANLLIVAGTVNEDQSGDEEERGAVRRMHELFDEYRLDGQVRWLGVRLDKNVSGELYRFIADRRGVFVQPALFEAFGLTVIEAMVSGLPTFATCYGGPLEIIEDGVNGFHINPNYGAAAAETIAEFLHRCEKEKGYWERIAGQGVERIKTRYTWKLYAQRMMTLSRVYGFWKYVTNLERDETRRYLEMLYGLQYRQRAATINRH